MDMKAFVIFTCFFYSSLMAIETPKYTIVKSSDPFEIREYESYVTAEVEVEGSFDEAGNKAFRALFNYISGNNTKKQSLEMTAPVEQKSSGESLSMTAPVEQRGKDGKYILSFVLPDSVKIDTAPTPNDPKVVLKNNPPRKIASITYSGFWSEANYNENLAKLLDWVQTEGLTKKSEPIYARYNAPFSLWFLRRNEILMEVGAPAPAPKSKK
jgi:hypothetical protein